MGRRRGAEPRGQHSLSVGASHQQGFRVKRQVEHTPFLAVWGQGPSMLTTEKEGLGEKASQGCWSKLQEVTHFSTQNADLLGFSAICPTDPWGAPPQHCRLLSVAFCYTYMEAFGSWRLHPRKRRMPREVGGASRGKRKQTLEVIARTRHPPGAEASTWAGPE